MAANSEETLTPTFKSVPSRNKTSQSETCKTVIRSNNESVISENLIASRLSGKSHNRFYLTPIHAVFSIAAVNFL